MSWKKGALRKSASATAPRGAESPCKTFGNLKLNLIEFETSKKINKNLFSLASRRGPVMRCHLRFSNDVLNKHQN